MTFDLAIVGVTIALLWILLRPRLYASAGWRAVVTPLASIIGSGFLVLGPIMHGAYGWAAPIAMAALCLIAWGFGAVIRFNIAAIERTPRGHGPGQSAVERLSSWALAFAYVVSVAYYLNLFGAFAARATGDWLARDLGTPAAREITTAMLLLILGVGWLRGFGGLERIEQVAVSLKLAIIGGLLLGLAIFATDRIAAGEAQIVPIDLTGWPAVTLLLGLLITVQGFETSRYLGDQYPADLRIRSMKQAQIISALIYLAYIGAITFAFAPEDVPLTETGVIDMMAIVAPILPPLLVVAALSAQLSAALADTGGSGGLFAEASRHRLSPRLGYTVVVVVGLGLTWLLDVFAIIAWASRAFAAYYALQSVLAAMTALRERRSGLRVATFSALALLGAAAAIFGTAVE